VRQTPQQRTRRDRVEALIGLAAPALDLVLNVGDRVSRTLFPQDSDYYPIRPAAEAFELGPAHRDPEQRKPREPFD
jgi:hypothetical protein